MRIKLKHKQTKKIKYITKPDTYPAEIGDEIRFRRYADFDDLWVVVAIKMGQETKAGAITPRQRLQLKSQLGERMKIRRRKEEARREHFYK